MYLRVTGKFNLLGKLLPPQNRPFILQSWCIISNPEFKQLEVYNHICEEQDDKSVVMAFNAIMRYQSNSQYN